jgi:hypothetical protein
MTVEEFAALPSDVHHAVWQAARECRIDAVPVSAQGTTCRYRRSQVLALQALLREAAR